MVTKRSASEISEEERQKILTWITDAILQTIEEMNPEIVQQKYQSDPRCAVPQRIFVWDFARKKLHSNKSFLDLFYDKLNMNTTDLKEFMSLVYDKLQAEGKISS